MDRKKMMLTTAALGAAYLMRNEKSRKKLMKQFQGLAERGRR
ncbi:hypothetical protein [Bacillus sp. JJ1764]